ncbi:MAG: YraN family protein [Deltaproteobacteria bacterium]|nr:YraN family protein [Deltaproteobacteria bacterium]
MPAHLNLGREGEALALKHLLGLGYEIVACNWRKGSYEIDFVCVDGDEVVFVEVKTRSSNVHGLPGQALDRNKARSLIRAAVHFLNDRDWWSRPCRFDLVSVLMHGTGRTMEHEKNVIDASAALGRGHSSWQPW